VVVADKTMFLVQLLVLVVLVVAVQGLELILLQVQQVLLILEAVAVAVVEDLAMEQKALEGMAVPELLFCL
jgi:hypothetical protein